MSKKFDSKKYQGKPRLFVKVPGTKDVRKILSWRVDREEYLPPQRGNLYVVRRNEIDDFGKTARMSKTFASHEDARKWESFADKSGGPMKVATSISIASDGGGTPLKEAIDEWRSRRKDGLALSTKLRYDDLIRRSFAPLLDIPVRLIKPATVDAWIDWLKQNKDQFGKANIRQSFGHELKLLRTIWNSYREYHDDEALITPFKRRHKEDVTVRNRAKLASKDLQEHEFYLFRNALAKGPHGLTLAILVSVQYFDATRISEAAALYWEDIEFNWTDPSESKIYFRRHVVYIRGSKGMAYIENGFKNSDSMNGVKVHPMLPEAFNALKSIYVPGASGLIFQNDDGSFFTYRQLQYAFNRAFRRAQLPYNSTHVLRHGGTRKTLEETGGDRDIAQQQLGNRDRRSIDIYAVRNPAALKSYVKRRWSETKSDEGVGNKWQQPEEALRIEQ